MNLKLLQTVILFVFLIITSAYAGAVVDVGIEKVVITDLSSEHAADDSPEPGEDFEVEVVVKNYGDEDTSGDIDLYIDDVKTDSWGTFSIKAGERISHKFITSKDDCSRYMVQAKIIIRNNVRNHDWELTVPVKVGKMFYVTISPEKAIVNKKTQIEVRDEYGMYVGDARIWIGNTAGTNEYRSGTTLKNDAFYFTPEHLGEMLIKVTKMGEGFCQNSKVIEVRHNFTVYGPYSNRYPDKPVAGDEIVLKLFDENAKAVAGASVTVSGKEKIVYLNSDEGGGVIFVTNESGKHTILVEKQIPLFWDANLTFDVLPKPELTIKMSPENPIVGDDVTLKITTKNVSNIDVTITNPEGFSRTIRTDRNNQVNFDVKLLGRYIITAETEGYEALDHEFEVHNLFKILVEPKNQVIGDNVTITILDQKDYPVPNAQVTITGTAQNKETEKLDINTDHTGEISLKLNSKRYEIYVKKNGYDDFKGTITPIIKELYLNLSSKKLIINEGDIHISVTEKDTKSPIDAVIKIKGERTGIEIEKTASAFTFTPEFADNYRVYVTKDYYDPVSADFVIEPSPIKIDAKLEDKELVLTVTSNNKSLMGIDVIITTPERKITTVTGDLGIVTINLDDEGSGEYSILAGKHPNYESSEIGIFVNKNYSLWWTILIFIIIFVTGFIIWKF